MEEHKPDAPSQAEILRLRKQRRARTTAAGTTSGAEAARYGRDGGEEELGERQDDNDDGGLQTGVVRRFAPQTGVVGKGDVDRHM